MPALFAADLQWDSTQESPPNGCQCAHGNCARLITGLKGYLSKSSSDWEHRKNMLQRS